MALVWKCLSLLVVIFLLSMGETRAARAQAVTRPACKLSSEEIAAGRDLAVRFFSPDLTMEDRLAMIDPGYIQHNPFFVQYAEQHRLTGRGAFEALMHNGKLGRRPPVPGGWGNPPPGDMLAVVTVDCDLVTVLHKDYRPLPHGKPGQWYTTFSFDTFRVRNARLVEHWDSALLN